MFPHVTILSDEIYDRLIFDKKEIPTLFNYPELYDRLIVLNGWSKTYAMTGWRLGWGVWPEHLVEHVIKFCVNNHSCVNAAVQFGGIAALDGSDDSITTMMEKFMKRRKSLNNKIKISFLTKSQKISNIDNLIIIFFNIYKIRKEN